MRTGWLVEGISPVSPYGVGIPPDGPHLEVSFVGLFPRALGSITSHYVTDFYRFFGLSWEDTISMLLFDMHADFFGRFVLQRNRYIRSAELFELSPILLLSRCLEAC